MNIFYKGKVYIDCGRKFPTKKFDGWDIETWERYANKELTSYPLIGESTFKDGQVVVEKKDYQIVRRPITEKYGKGTYVAIPIQTTSFKEDFLAPTIVNEDLDFCIKEETQDELWKEAIEDIRDFKRFGLTDLVKVFSERFTITRK